MAAAASDNARNANAEHCGAATRSGGKCAKSPGWGTDHVGVGRCRLHGGSTPSHIANAAKIMQTSMLGVEIDMEPHDALLWCVRVSAGMAAFFTTKVRELTAVDVVVEHRRERDWTGGRDGGGTETITSSSAELHLWVRAQQDAVDRLAKFAKMALDAGVAERQVKLAEQWGTGLSTLIGGVLGDLKLTPEQQRRAPEIVRRHLTLLEGGGQTEAAA